MVGNKKITQDLRIRRSKLSKCLKFNYLGSVITNGRRIVMDSFEEDFNITDSLAVVGSIAGLGSDGKSHRLIQWEKRTSDTQVNSSDEFKLSYLP